jgi:CheY-like chemotaxis protein
MPVMDGLESTRLIREFEQENRLKPVTIVALTALASSSIQQEAFATGIDLFLTKPVKLKELRQLVDAIKEKSDSTS